MSANGAVNLFVLCVSCGEQIGVHLIAHREGFARLHQYFSVKCPTCRTSYHYHRSDLYVGSASNGPPSAS